MVVSNGSDTPGAGFYSLLAQVRANRVRGRRARWYAEVR